MTSIGKEEYRDTQVHRPHDDDDDDGGGGGDPEELPPAVPVEMESDSRHSRRSTELHDLEMRRSTEHHDLEMFDSTYPVGHGAALDGGGGGSTGAKSATQKSRSAPRCSRGAQMCWDRIVSIKFILPATVALALIAMAGITIGLMAVSTQESVNTVVSSLQTQVLTVVENKITDLLATTIVASNMSANSLLAITPPPWDPNFPNSSLMLPTFLPIVAVLDQTMGTFRAYVDSVFFYHVHGRLQAVFVNEYGEEDPPNGNTYWPYQTGNLTSLQGVYNRTPIGTAPTFVGYEQPQFVDASRTVPFNYMWMPPFAVAGNLLIPLAVSVIDSTGVFRGVVGCSLGIPQLQAFLIQLRPTPQTVTYVTSTNGLLLMASEGAVLNATTGARLSATQSTSGVVAASALSMGPFDALGTAEVHATFTYQGSVWLLSYVLFNQSRLTAYIVVLTPQAEFLGAADARTNDTIGICVAVAVIGVGFVVALSIKIGLHLGRLEKNLDAVSQLQFSESADEDASTCVASDAGDVNIIAGASLMYHRAHGDNSSDGGGFTELERIQDAYKKLRTAVKAFKHYVPVHVVRGLINGTLEAKLSMRPTQAAVSFHDIVNFTTICEALAAATVLRRVSQCFERMSKCIMATDGIIDKYIGDCIMAFWEVGHVAEGTRHPMTVEDVCVASLTASSQAYSCSSTVDNMSIRLRTGVNFGPVLIGNFGSTSRFSYTVVGDTLNAAARLEPLNKELKTEVVTADDVVRNLPPDHALRQCLRALGAVAVIGKSQPVEVYELRQHPLSPEGTLLWNQSIAAFAENRTDDALLYARRARESAPDFDDPATDAYIEALQSWVPGSPAGLRKQTRK